MDTTQRMTPVATAQRIHAMDVLRGFALGGIALMNVEFFNRPATDFSGDLSAAWHGWDRVAGWLVIVFVTGKFWVLFSLLFGMGFALMLRRAQAQGLPFLRTYLRRTVALGVFGIAHAVLLWTGDILYGYAITAAMLLLALFGKWWHWPVAATAFLVIGAVVGALPAWSSHLAVLAVSALLALYLRRPESKPGFGLLPWLLLFAGSTLLIVGVHSLLRSKLMPGLPMLVFATLLIATSWLAWRLRDPASGRAGRAGFALFALLVLAPFTVGAVMTLMPPAPTPTAKQQAAYRKHQDISEQRDRANELASRSSRYLDGVEQRAKTFAMFSAPSYGAFSIMALSIFLIGTWLVDRGLVEHAATHAQFWRRWLWLWPLGVAVTALSVHLSPTPPEGMGPHAQATIALALRNGAALPMALGYMAMILLGLQKTHLPRWLLWMAPAGRMALTNYLLQSLVCAFVFYGWGLHQWGMPRHQQVLLVLLLWLAQLGFSKLWLNTFRYGPMEWLWRWLTYRHRPAMRAPVTA